MIKQTVAQPGATETAPHPGCRYQESRTITRQVNHRREVPDSPGEGLQHAESRKHGDQPIWRTFSRSVGPISQ